MPDIKIKRYADKENLKKLVKYSKDTFANKSEINEKFYTKEQIDTMLESGSGGGGGTGGDYYTKSEIDEKFYTKSEVDNLLSNIGSGTEGGDDAQGGLSFYTAVERAPGYDGTSQMNISEDYNTVEDE